MRTPRANAGPDAALEAAPCRPAAPRAGRACPAYVPGTPDRAPSGRATGGAVGSPPRSQMARNSAGPQGETSERKAIVMATQHLLVPVDCSENAQQALEYAIRLASKLEARLTLLHVIQALPLGGGDMGVTVPYTYLEVLEAEIARRMQACLERVTAVGLEGESIIVKGVPFQEILETAKTQQVDLIVMGTFGRTGLQHLLLGSVAEKVVRLAPCPVLVVRQPTVTVVPVS